MKRTSPPLQEVHGTASFAKQLPGRLVLVFLAIQAVLLVWGILDFSEVIEMFGEDGFEDGYETLPPLKFVATFVATVRLIQVWAPIAGIWLSVERSRWAATFWSSYFLLLIGLCSTDLAILEGARNRLTYSRDGAKPLLSAIQDGDKWALLRAALGLAFVTWPMVRRQLMGPSVTRSRIRWQWIAVLVSTPPLIVGVAWALTA
ncbi:MAG: hypothetical protein MPN21_04715 [Thermoanaerobaculia bacterium]|nr:hypothetical protein [Thermoanaerobaculia bacterium]